MSTRPVHNAGERVCGNEVSADTALTPMTHRGLLRSRDKRTGLGDAPPSDRDSGSRRRSPRDLTAEAASDTNELGDGDRGVFLTWNMVESKTASETTAYRIERIADGHWCGRVERCCRRLGVH